MQEVVQQVKVRVKELQSKMKRKSDIFYMMRHMCKKRSSLIGSGRYHLPEYDDSSIQFMRDILTGTKKGMLDALD